MTSIKPGCYGFAMTFSKARGECTACVHSASCEVRSSEARQRLTDVLGARFPDLGKPKAREVGQPSVKVVALVERFENAGINIRRSLSEGLNPFLGHKCAFMSITCHLLLRVNGGFSRRTLMDAMMRKFGWIEPTASTHATVALKVLGFVDAVEEIDGLFKRKAI